MVSGGDWRWRPGLRASGACRNVRSSCSGRRCWRRWGARPGLAFPRGPFSLSPSLPQAGCWGRVVLRGVGALLRAALAAASRPQARQRQLEEGDALGRAPSAPRGAGLRYRRWQKATGNSVLSGSRLSSCVLPLVELLSCLVFLLLRVFVRTPLERVRVGLLYNPSSDICIH